MAQHHRALSFGETTTVGLPQYALSEVGKVRAGIQSSRAFNRGRIGHRSRIAHRPAFLITRFCGPDGDQLGFAVFGRAVGLLARAIRDFLGAHRHPGSIHSQVHGGSHFSALFHWLVFIDGDLGPSASAALSTCLALTSTPANSCNNPLLSSK